jgi:polysaccharide biosynthesis transport protein
MMLARRGNAAASGRTSHADLLQPTEYDVRYTQRAGEPTMAPEIHFQQFVGILRRRARLILMVAACGTMLAGVAGLLIPTDYTAKAQIVVEPQQANLLVGRAAVAPPPDQSAIDTQVTMLTSRDHLQRVLDSLSEGSADPMATEVGALSFDDLERRLKVKQERASRVIGVSFTSTNPEWAAAVANRVVQLYAEGQSAQRREYATGELARLDKRIAELKTEMERAGTAMPKPIQKLSGTVQATGSEGREAEARLRDLARETATTGQLYDSLLRRQKEIRDQQETIAPDVRIVSLASPPRRPSSPNPILFILPALIVSSICGGFLAVILERLDRGLRSERDINDALGIPCIGLVPRLPRMRRTRPHKYLLTKPSAAYTEAIRSVAAALHLATPNDAPATVLISSSVPREGKTTLAVSLAVYVAFLQRRVLLVDLDFRNPSILRELGSKAERGILDLHLHNRPLAEVVQHMPDLGLDYLPICRCPDDPLALFASGQMPRLLHQLREGYDCVIIDGPPLLGVAEARLLASMVDKVLFVVKWGSTRREVAQNALDLLRKPGRFDENRVKLPSALVAQVDLKKHARYRYGDVGESFVKYRKYFSRSIRAG